MIRSLLLTSLLAGCAATPIRTPHERVADLSAALTGTFSSAAQASADPENFFDIQLVMQPIWLGRDDGPWLYVEQAAATALDRPYRQRVYHLVALPDGRLVSNVYTLPGDPLEFAGAWDRPAQFDGLSPSDLRLREGCSIYLESIGPGTYAGQTEGKGCASSLRGADYATSEVTLAPGKLTSWDRGWTNSGDQAWGAEKGPYVFERVE